jgi:hypothetical protein
METIYSIGPDDVKKIKIGDTIRFHSRIGKIASLPKYETGPSYGLWFADVLWEGKGKMRHCLNLYGTEIDVSDPKNMRYIGV